MRLFAATASPGRPYWWDDVTWPELEDALPAQVDLLVIGAGYTGLSAAIAAHDAGATVAVIEAGQPGQGASTRNGGMLGAHPRLSWDKLAARYGVQTADALFAEAGAALDWVRGFVEQEKIACDFAQTGRIQLAYTARQFAAQKELAAQVSQRGGVACDIIPRDALAQEIETPIYHGAMVFPGHAGLHPAKYFLGMLDAALRRGIAVVPECPAEGVARVSGGHEITTAKGRITASKVILATNGYTRQPFARLAARVFALPSFLIATVPLSSNLIGKLAPGRRMMVETRARHSYFRISPDGSRVIFGGRAAMVDIALDKAAQRLRATLGEIWPDLAEVELSHAWSGHTGFTFDQMPHVGVSDGMHYAMGYCGGGTVLAPYLGRKAALQALGLSEGETAFSRTTLGTRWFHHGGTPHFLQAANLWYRHVVDRRECRASKEV